MPLCQEHSVAGRPGAPKLTTSPPCPDACLASISEMISLQDGGAKICPFRGARSVTRVSIMALWDRHAHSSLASTFPLFPRIINNSLSNPEAGVYLWDCGGKKGTTETTASHSVGKQEACDNALALVRGTMRNAESCLGHTPEPRRPGVPRVPNFRA